MIQAVLVAPANQTQAEVITQTGAAHRHRRVELEDLTCVVSIPTIPHPPAPCRVPARTKTSHNDLRRSRQLRGVMLLMLKKVMSANLVHEKTSRGSSTSCLKTYGSSSLKCSEDNQTGRTSHRHLKENSAVFLFGLTTYMLF